MRNRGYFGPALRAVRKKTKTRLNTITEGMGWSKSYLMDLETGRSGPPKKVLIYKLCQLMGATDEFGYLIEMALREKSKLTIQMNDSKPEATKAAVLLTRKWGNISDETFIKIQQLLEAEADNDPQNTEGSAN